MKILIPIVFFTLLFSCKKKDNTPNPPPTKPIDYTIDNKLISGNSTTSFSREITNADFGSVQQINDGSYILCGSAISPDKGGVVRDVVLLKTNSLGETIWMKRFSEDTDNQGKYVIVTNDNNFVFSIYSSSTAINNSLLNTYSQLIKVDSNGILVWNKSFGNDLHFSSIKETSDGGIVTCGSEISTSNRILLKIDANGNELWRQTYSGLISLRSLNTTSDDGFVICGTIQDSINAIENEYIIRANATGNIVWTKTFKDTINFYPIYPTSIIETTSGNIAMCGVFGHVRFINSLGDELWNYKSSINTFYSIDITNDNKLIVTGFDHWTDNIIEAHLLKLDESGNLIFQKSFQGGDLNQIKSTLDNGIVSVGGAWFLKTDENGN